MLTRIRNANMLRRKQVTVLRNRVCLGIAGVLKEEGYIHDFAAYDDGKQGLIRIDLKYGEGGVKVVQDLQRASKPGRRVYRGATELPRVMDGLGIVILSTSRGVVSDRQARKLGIGGELLCSVW
jgi:small subunit ribosomal protein S8